MGKKPGPKDKEVREARRAAVKDFIETLGPYSVPVKMLAEKHDVAPTIIYGDIKFWMKKLDLKGVELQGKKLIQHAIKNLSIIEEERASGDPMKRLRAVQASCQATDEVVKLLEGFGYKQKVPEPLEVDVSVSAREELLESIRKVLGR